MASFNSGLPVFAKPSTWGSDMKTYRVIKISKTSEGRAFRVVLPNGKQSVKLFRHEISSWLKHHAGSLQEAQI